MNKLHNLLRMKDEGTIAALRKSMGDITGKMNVVSTIEEETEAHVMRALKNFGVQSSNPTTEEVYEAVILQLKKSDEELNTFLGGKIGEEFTLFPELLARGRELMKPKRVWVLKKEKFREILEEFPPPHILETFGYKDGKELFIKEKLEEVASSLRFMESSEWMHDTFDKAYRALTPEDFEEREVEAIVLSAKWREAAAKFVEKKRHNLSHLKELGLIFVIPITVDSPGELMRVFTLYLHYLYEVQFYSDLFKQIAKEENFGEQLISLLRGDVLNEAPKAAPGSYNWLIVQRYLAKDDEWDGRLFVPHMNPESIHWRRAEDALVAMDNNDSALSLSFWHDLDWVGWYFQGDGKKLLSFDIIDMIMSLANERMYVYHQQEALWTRLFESYVGGLDVAEQLVKENLLKGYITIS